MCVRPQRYWNPCCRRTHRRRRRRRAAGVGRRRLGGVVVGQPHVDQHVHGVRAEAVARGRVLQHGPRVRRVEELRDEVHQEGLRACVRVRVSV